MAGLRLQRLVPLSALTLILTICLAPAIVFSQEEGGTGVVVGQVFDLQNQPISGAQVRYSIGSDPASVTTKSDGSFRIEDAPVGTLLIRIEAPGYRSGTRSVEVIAGEEVAVSDVKLDASDARTIDVRGALVEGGSRQVLLDRKAAASVGDALSQEEIGRAPVGDAAGAVAKLPAVSIQGGKFAFVRGLGDRYSQTLINGATLPSPEPEKRVLPLDLFPSNLIRGIVVTKAYSPDLPGEFAGGSVQITTVDVPEEPFFRVSVSSKFQDNASFRNFRTYRGGAGDAFTYDNGTRELPGAVPSNRVPGSGGAFDDQVRAIGLSFNNIWNADTRTAPLDHNLSLSFGKRWELGVGTLGLIGAANWSNEYRTIEREEFRTLQNQGTGGIGIRSEFSLDTYTFSAEASALAALTYELGPGWKVGVRQLISRSSDDRVREQIGFRGGDPLETVLISQLRWVERMIYNNQVFGEHLLVGDWFLKWRTNFSVTERDEPDNRQVRYLVQDGVFTLEDLSGSGSRDFYFLDEDVADYAVDLMIPFNPFDMPDTDPLDIARIQPEQKIQFGATYTFRDRSFDGRRLRFRARGLNDINGDPIDLTLPPEQIFSPDNLNPDGIVLIETTRPTDSYAAEQTLAAAYGMVDIKVHPRVRMQAGVRVESSNQEVETFALFGVPPDVIRAELDETDFLPALNLTFDLTRYDSADLENERLGTPFKRDPKMQLRLAASQTVSRPEFRELAEFQFTDVAEGFAARGNPDLDRALIQHLDLRWEWFPNPAEVISVSAFAKTFDSPIERVIIPTGSSLITSWENAESGELFGLEFEIKKRLENLGFADVPFLRNIAIQTNLAVIESEVEIDSSNTTVVQTNSKRPLQGQPDYTFNLGILYENLKQQLQAGFFVGSFGKTISGVGAFGLPDTEEQPRFDVDFKISKRFGASAVSLSVENILNDRFQIEQGPFVISERKTGIAVGVSYSYTF